jgi:hypothetical protein
MKQAHCLIVLLGALTLSACGGGGGGGGGTTGATYTIGGTLSGLGASTQLVLEDNGGNALTLQGNGAFTFSQAIAGGSAYSVTVATQPNGQTCSVSGGSGTANANVANVGVTCSASSSSTYTIGGTAQGVAMYSSSGMVLQDNGGNDLTVTSDGAFTFSEPVNSGAAYDVMVKTQPTGETCTVTGGMGTASSNVTGVSISCSSALASGGNVAPVSVGTFPSDVMLSTFNVPIVTVTVCDAAATCKDVQVVIDTGSSGLRLIASAVSGLNLTAEPAGGGTLFECAYYADGYAWGGVDTAAQVKIGGETASNVPVQVIEAGSGTTPPADVPTNCSNNAPPSTTDLDSADDFSADGVLGIGPAAQDCGSACTSTAIYYYSCPGGGCTAGTAATTVAAVTDEVTNPVTLFAKDNNGTLLQLPTISANGVAMTSGYVAFGVGTESNNGIGNATILPLSATQPQQQPPLYINTSFNNQSSDGIIDSGSNAFFFTDSALTVCTDFSPFYCPSTTSSLTATNTGGSAPSQVSFQIANFDTLAASMFYAYNDVGGEAPTVNGTTYFDWGLPFFYGRTVYTIIPGATVGGQTYAQGAFAY